MPKKKITDFALSDLAFAHQRNMLQARLDACTDEQRAAEIRLQIAMVTCTPSTPFVFPKNQHFGINRN